MTKQLPPQKYPLLTDRQRKFVAEYLIDLNGAKAAIRAGFAPGNSRTEASRLLANVNVREALQDLMNARGERTRVTADRVIDELSRIAFGSILSVAVWDPEMGVQFLPSETLDDSTAAAIQEVSEKRTVTRKDDFETTNIQLKVKMHDKLKALELLGRHLGILQKSEEMTIEELLAVIKVRGRELLMLTAPEAKE